jgi:hypothetical protein
MELYTDELLIAQVMDGYKAFHLASEKNHVETLKRMWVWAEKTPFNPKELKNKLLLSKDNFGYMAWHSAAQEDSPEALQLFWSWAKEMELNTDDFLLAQNSDG